MLTKRVAVVVERMGRNNGSKPQTLSRTLAADNDNEGDDKEERGSNLGTPDLTPEQSRFGEPWGHVFYPWAFARVDHSESDKQDETSILPYNKLRYLTCRTTQALLPVLAHLDI